ncbi:MAG: acyl-CoA dehydrogenase family protein [Bdellovibrionota bacterium]|nr:MAG: acyl-CoA dehydrogenase family protein [Bdellovibrionota bacterium]
MLRLTLGAELEALRQEFRSWVAAHPVPRPKSAALDEFQRCGREWQRLLASGRWLGLSWPQAFGGRGLNLVADAVVQEEMVRANAPQVLGLFGLTMVGPVLIRHGTDAQRARFLAKILDASEIWCQGFSEPGAGSDLANVATRAERVGNSYRINGQKVWTSFAHIADWCFLLCRTSQGKAKHEGLSYLLVPMKQAGIQVRPLKQISGDEEFNEVFFDNVEAPADCIVGQEGEGWKIAISTLMFERVVLTFARQLQSESLLRRLLELPQAEQFRDELASCVATATAVRALAYTHLISYANGKQPGPEGSLDKLFWSESFQEIADLGVRMLGSRAVLGEEDPEVGMYLHQYLYSRGRTIAAGTSEIQRNIIAERVVGLPRSGER